MPTASERLRRVADSEPSTTQLEDAARAKAESLKSMIQLAVRDPLACKACGVSEAPVPPKLEANDDRVSVLCGKCGRRLRTVREEAA